MANTNYFGAYAQASEVTQEDSSHLASNESVIGAELQLGFEKAEDGDARVTISSARGYSLGAFDTAFSERLTKAHDANLTCRAFLSAVIYSDERGLFWGEVGVICYPPDEVSAWERFTEQARLLIAKGDHPDIKLTDKEVNQVLSSQGTWSDMKTMQHASLKKGAVYFKKKRSKSDSLVESAVAGNKGCKASAYIFYVVLALVIGYLIWRFFF